MFSEDGGVGTTASAAGRREVRDRFVAALRDRFAVDVRAVLADAFRVGRLAARRDARRFAGLRAFAARFEVARPLRLAIVFVL